MAMRVETGYKPRLEQVAIHAGMATSRFAVLVCHRRFGKTVCAVNALIDAALRFRRSDGRFAYMAPYYGQAKKVAWDYFKLFAHMIPGVKFNESELSISFSNGSLIRLYGADNPDALRGIYLDGVVLDEVADMKPNVWGEVIRPALADRQGWALFIGTPKGINLFYELYQQALSDPTWFAAMYRADQTNIIPEEELAAARVDMSDSQYAQEFLCDFAASNDDVLIPVSLALEAAGRTRHDVEVKGMYRVMGVDVARYGNDKSVIIRRTGIKVYEPIIIDDISNTDFAHLIMREINDYNPESVNIDAGRGEGVIDVLRDARYRVNEINFGATQGVDKLYRNKRAEMWHGIKKWMESGGCIPNNTQLIKELSVQTYSMASDVFTLTSKDKMRKDGIPSPDIADALALTFATRRPLSGGQTPKKAPGGGLKTTRRSRINEANTGRKAIFH